MLAKFIETSSYYNLNLNSYYGDNNSLIFFATKNLYQQLHKTNQSYNISDYIAKLRVSLYQNENILNLYEEKYILKSQLENSISDEKIKIGYINTLNKIFDLYSYLQYQNIYLNEKDLYLLNDDFLFTQYNSFIQNISQQPKSGYIACLKKQILSFVKQFKTIVFVGFIYLNPEQYFILDCAKSLGLNIIVISKEPAVLEKLFKPLLSSYKIEQITLQGPSNKFTGITQNLFKKSQIKENFSQDICFYKGFENKEDELNFVVDSIVDLITKDKNLISKVAIVVAKDKAKYERYIDEILKEKAIIIDNKRLGVKCHKSLNETKFGSFIKNILNIVSQYDYASLKSALLFIEQSNISLSAEILDVYLRTAENIDDLIDTVQQLKEYKNEIKDRFEYRFHPIIKIDDKDYDMLVNVLGFIKDFCKDINTYKTISEYYNVLLNNLNKLEQANLFSQDEIRFIDEFRKDIENLKWANYQKVDYAFFISSIQEMLNQIYEEYAEEKININIVNKENISIYDYVFVISFDNGRYPTSLEKDMFLSKLKKLQKIKQIYLPLENDYNYSLEIDKFLFRNIFGMANHKIVFTYSKNSNIRPKSISFYYNDLNSIFQNKLNLLKYKKTNISYHKKDFEWPLIETKLNEIRLISLLKFYLCPKCFYYDLTNYKNLYYCDDFSLNYYYRAVIFYKLFKNLSFKNEIYNLHTFREAIKNELQIVKQEELKYFSFLNFNLLKDIDKFIISQIERFITDNFLKRKTQNTSFKVELRKPYKLIVNDVAVIIDARISLTNIATNESVEFDISKNLELLVGKTNNNRCQFTHFNEIVERLRKQNRYDDRLEMLQTLNFKINTQLSANVVQFKKDGIERIRNIIDEIKEYNSFQPRLIPNDFCKYCKCKQICKEDDLL